jgi:nucleoside-diphosphate-sugar epimerase
VPFFLAHSLAFDMECIGRLFKWKEPPFITRYATWLLGRYVYYSIEKAQKELGWTSTVSYDEGIPKTVEWYLNQEKQNKG